MNEEVGFTAEELCVLNESQIKGGSRGYVPCDLKMDKHAWKAEQI